LSDGSPTEFQRGAKGHGLKGDFGFYDTGVIRVGHIGVSFELLSISLCSYVLVGQASCLSNLYNKVRMLRTDNG